MPMPQFHPSIFVMNRNKNEPSSAKSAKYGSGNFLEDKDSEKDK